MVLVSAVDELAILALLAMLGVVVAIGALRMRALRQRIEALARQVITDPLTGAYNRRHLDAALATAIERRRRMGEPASLLLFDIDRFKGINDAVGHPAGDEVLRRLVRLVAERARQVDVLCRIGGEEFALVLAGAVFGDALAVAEDLRALVAGARLFDNTPVSISVGVSELRDGDSVQDWLEDADAALYRAKREGRNRVAGAWHAPVDSAPRKGFRLSIPI